MKRTGLLLFISQLVVLGLCSTPQAPKWPSQFEMSYTLSLPYVSSLQPGGLKMPLHVFFDGPNKQLHMSAFYGMDDTYILPGVTYMVFPRINTKTCWFLNTTTGPTLGLLGNEQEDLQPLPDLATWDYAGEGHLSGQPPSYVWQLTQRYFEKVNTYTFYVAQSDNRPLALHVVGVNPLGGSHYDQYEFNFITWVPKVGSARSFTPPHLCDDAIDPDDYDPSHSLKDAQEQGAFRAAVEAVARRLLGRTEATEEAGSAGRLRYGQRLGRAAAIQAMSLLPGAHVPAVNLQPATDSDCSVHKAAQSLLRELRKGATSVWASTLSLLGVQGPELNHASSAVYDATDAQSQLDPVTAANLEFIARFNKEAEEVKLKQAAGSNAQAPTFRLAPNKFIGWTDDRWQASVLGYTKPSSSRRSMLARWHDDDDGFNRSGAYLGYFQRSLSDDQLPKSVDWRGTGADGPVKDQATCGSCWAFATAGAMTGAWYLATGQSLSLSEQQIVDCSWDHDVNGCSGGFMEGALDYIHEAGGAAMESSYTYMGQNGQCRSDKVTKAAHFKGYQLVAEKDEKAMMEAVATHGPIAISFDAVHPTFKYYSEGVYYRADCGDDEDHLNHAVVLLGYGTDKDGTDYWLLRNSWSTMWGDNGYFKLARKGNDCGITIGGVLAVIDKEAAAKAATPEGLAAAKAARERAVTMA